MGRIVKYLVPGPPSSPLQPHSFFCITARSSPILRKLSDGWQRRIIWPPAITQDRVPGTISGFSQMFPATCHKEGLMFMTEGHRRAIGGPTRDIPDHWRTSMNDSDTADE